MKDRKGWEYSLYRDSFIKIIEKYKNNNTKIISSRNLGALILLMKDHGSLGNFLEEYKEFEDSISHFLIDWKRHHECLPMIDYIAQPVYFEITIEEL